MKRRTFTYIVSICVITIAVGWYGVKHFRQSKTRALAVVSVKTAPVKTTTLPLTIHAIGTLTARSVNITPEIPGHVKKILFKDGLYVEKNTPLIQLDDAIYQAKAASTKAQFIYSEQNLNRMLQLGKGGAIAQQAIDQANAEAKEKKALAEEGDMMLNKMQLKAPFAGKLGKSLISKGDYVTIGQKLVTITDTKHLRIEYNVPESYLRYLKLGQAIQIKTNSYPDKTFNGKLAFIAPTVSRENHAILLYAEIDNSDGLLVPGMFVNVEHILDNQQQVLMIPARSLVPMLDSVQVYKVVNHKAIATTVLIGRRTESTVQILQGLAANDQVVTDGQLKIRNGETVNSVNDPA